MDTKLYLFRELRDQDMHWHHVGPHHERLSFNLLDLVGYAPVKHNDQPPYRLYNPFNWRGPKMPENSHATLDAVKAAGRAHALEWLAQAGRGEVIWEALDSGVHWRATADGVDMASYYYSDGTLPKYKTREKWHVGFRVWFGGTYYVIDFANPEAARAEVARTWRHWLAVAQERFLANK